jgi:hypothetical protein
MKVSQEKEDGLNEGNMAQGLGVDLSKFENVKNDQIIETNWGVWAYI